MTAIYLEDLWKSMSLERLMNAAESLCHWGIDRLGALPLSSSSSRHCRFWTVAWADVEALCLDGGIGVVSVHETGGVDS
jgi:hypothetical protein